MRSIPNPEHRDKRSRFVFSICLGLALVSAFTAASFVTEGRVFTGQPVHGASFAGGSATLAGGESCASAVAIGPALLPFTDDSSTVGAANDIDPGPDGCASGLGVEVVYSFTPSATDTYVAGVTPIAPGFDVSLYIVTNCADPSGSCVAGTDARSFAEGESLVATLNAGTTYFIVIDSPQQSGQGQYHFVLRKGLPANDSCASPVVIEPSRLPFQASATTFGATNDTNPGTPCLRSAQSGGGPDVVYQFTPASGQNYDFTVTPAANYDASLYVVTNCVNATGCRGMDLRGGGAPETLRRNLNAGTTYFIVIDGSQGDFGDFMLTIVPTIPLAPPAPTNLTATAINSTRIDLVWQDNSGDEIGFRINRSLDGSNFTEIASVGANVTTFSDNNLSPSTTYFYQVLAFNNFGNSAPSNIAPATTPGSPVPEFPVINADPASVDFGTVSSAQAATRPLTISNAGGSNLVLSNIIDPAAPFSILDKPPVPATIPPGQSLVLTVRFAPTGAQGFSGSLSILSNDPSNGDLEVQLNGIGTGTPVPNLELTTAVLTFPSGSSNVPYEVGNTGNADLFVSSITQPAAPFAIGGIPSLPATLKPGEKFVMTISFSPSALGVFSSEFRIVCNDPDSLLVVVRVRGTSTTPVPRMPGLDFINKGIRFDAAGSNVVVGALLIVDGTQTFALARDGQFFKVGKKVRSTPGNLRPRDIFAVGSTHSVQVVNPDGTRSPAQNLTR
ncbi:MAG: choice-of-anchor D domain-containing protein [Blastocatellia bacterium]